MNPLAGMACTSLGHSFDGSMRDENGKCAKCEKLHNTFSVQKRYPQFDVRLPVVAIDFDGVLARNTWPSPALGEPDPDAIEMVKHYYSRGCEVIVFTARPASHHERIRQWLAENSIFYAVYDVTNIKPVASVYVDDRAVRWPL